MHFRDLLTFNFRQAVCCADLDSLLSEDQAAFGCLLHLQGIDLPRIILQNSTAPSITSKARHYNLIAEDRVENPKVLPIPNLKPPKRTPLSTSLTRIT